MNFDVRELDGGLQSAAGRKDERRGEKGLTGDRFSKEKFCQIALTLRLITCPNP
jgi:hypothetical protein